MRTLSSAIAAASVAPVIRCIFMVRIDFDSGTVAWHSGFGIITYNSVDYSGVGTLGTISQVKEEPGVKSSSLSLVISGIKTEVVSMAMSEPYMNRKAWVHMQVLDDQDRPYTQEPLLLFKGTLDGINGTFGNEASFQISTKSRLADWERPRTLRYTDADQQKLYPGDKGMEYIPQLSQRQLIWPRAAFLPDPRD